MEIVNICKINGVDESGIFPEETNAVRVPTYRKYTIGIDEAARYYVRSSRIIPAGISFWRSADTSC